MTRLSVIIISLNEGESLRRTVDNLLATMPPSSEIIVVDDRSTDQSTGFLSEGYSGVTLLRPDARLGVEVPNRPRTYRVLGHHMFRIAETFLEVAAGAALTYDSLTAPPPEAMQRTAEIVAYGDAVRGRLASWWDA